MRIILIRHGQSTGDVEDRYGGAYDDELSPQGERQAQELAEEMAGLGIETLFASPLKRALQTAQAIRNRVACPLHVMDGLRERDRYGLLSGMTKVQAKRDYPDLAERAKDLFATLPSAESYEAAAQRMSETYADVLAQTRNCSAVLWHGGGMRVLFRDILEQGEPEEVGDCGWVELMQSNPLEPFTIKQFKRLRLSAL